MARSDTDPTWVTLKKQLDPTTFPTSLFSQTHVKAQASAMLASATVVMTAGAEMAVIIPCRLQSVSVHSTARRLRLNVDVDGDHGGF